MMAAVVGGGVGAWSGRADQLPTELCQSKAMDTVVISYVCVCVYVDTPVVVSTNIDDCT